MKKIFNRSLTDSERANFTAQRDQVILAMGMSMRNIRPLSPDPDRFDNNVKNQMNLFNILPITPRVEATACVLSNDVWMQAEVVKQLLARYANTPVAFSRR